MAFCNFQLNSENAKKESLFTQKRIFAGLRYFAMFTVLGLAILFYLTSTSETFAALSKLKWPLLVSAAFLQIVDIGFGAWRNHVLVRIIKPGVPPWLCFKAQLANEFGAAVTPGQSGGGPAWLFILYRGGIPVLSAAAVSVLVFLTTLLFFLITTAISILFIDDRISSGILLSLLHYGFITCSILLIFILLSLWMPDRLSRALDGIVQRLRTTERTWLVKSAALVEQALSGMQLYQNTGMQLLRENRAAIFKTFLVTSLYYFGKLNLAFLLLLGLGLQVDYLAAMAVLALLRFILYFSPTPGGSGLGEFSIAALMSTIMPSHILPIYTVLYRAFHLFLPASFGAWILLSELKKKIRNKTRIMSLL